MLATNAWNAGGSSICFNPAALRIGISRSAAA
jgi:hypothetical protein